MPDRMLPRRGNGTYPITLPDGGPAPLTWSVVGHVIPDTITCPPKTCTRPSRRTTPLSGSSFRISNSKATCAQLHDIVHAACTSAADVGWTPEIITVVTSVPANSRNLPRVSQPVTMMTPEFQATPAICCTSATDSTSDVETRTLRTLSYVSSGTPQN